MRAQCPLVGPVLTAQHSAAWLAFAREHQNWQVRHWRPILFTEESRFIISTCDRRERVWRHRGKHYTACNIIEHDRFEGGWCSVMVWRGISLEGCINFHMLANSSLTTLTAGKELGWNLQTHCQTVHRWGGPWVPPGAGLCLMWPEYVGSSWMRKASMPLTGPHVPQTWIQLRTSGMLCISASAAVSSGACPDIVRSANRHVGAIHTTEPH